MTVEELSRLEDALVQLAESCCHEYECHDKVLDLVDRVVGWCSPDQDLRLAPSDYQRNIGHDR